MVSDQSSPVARSRRALRSSARNACPGPHPNSIRLSLSEVKRRKRKRVWLGVGEAHETPGHPAGQPRRIAQLRANALPEGLE
jgi:hypothetical protein